MAKSKASRRRQPRYWVADEVAGKKVVVTSGRGRKVKQEMFFLDPNASEIEINRLITAGVDISHFDGTDEGLDVLSRFVGSKKQEAQRLTPTIKTTLVPVKKNPEAIKRAEARNLADWALQKVLTAAGIDAETFASVKSASLEELETMEWKKVGKALGISGNFGVQRVFDELNG